MLEQERQATVERLALAYALGHLSTDSLEHRLERALAAPARTHLAWTAWDLPDGDAHPEAFLRLGGHDLSGTRERSVWVVGRSRACDIRLEDDTVSARHARIACRGGRWTVTDLGSTNGTRLNGDPVEHALLRPGDTLHLGTLAARLTT